MLRILCAVIFTLPVSGFTIAGAADGCAAGGSCNPGGLTTPAPGVALAAGPAADYHTAVDRPTLDCRVRRHALLVPVPVQPVTFAPVPPVAIVPVRPVVPVPTRGYTYVERRLGLLGLGGRVVHFQQYGQ